MDNYWNRQVVLITGGSGGIGREMVRHLTGLGCRVAINFLQQEDKAADLLRELDTDRARIYQADVGHETQVNEMVERIEADFGAVTVLINNAGIIRNNLLITMSNDDWDSVIRTHLTGTFYCTRRVLRNMIKAHFGRIINVSSISGVQGEAGQVHYASAKAGAIAFAKSLAQEVGTKGITCNSLVLNLFNTENARRRVKPEIFQRIVDHSPLRRAGEPPEVAHAIEYLAGPNSSLMTGQVVTL